MNTLFFSFLFLLLQTIPYKASEEFKVELEYKFKAKSGASSSTTIIMDDQGAPKKKAYPSGILPYLVVNLRVLKLSEFEVRIKIVKSDGSTLLSRKVDTETVYKIDMGFTDDMKDRVTPHEFMIYFLTQNKKQISVITLYIKEDGTFLINDEVRGKF